MSVYQCTSFLVLLGSVAWEHTTFFDLLFIGPLLISIVWSETHSSSLPISNPFTCCCMVALAVFVVPSEMLLASRCFWHIHWVFHPIFWVLGFQRVQGGVFFGSFSPVVGWLYCLAPCGYIKYYCEIKKIWINKKTRYIKYCLWIWSVDKL